MEPHRVRKARQKFTSQERDNETGLDYMHARYFASAQGRFSSADSFGGSIGNPQSLNRYAYVVNNPINLSDPTGHEAARSASTHWMNQHEGSLMLGAQSENFIAELDYQNQGAAEQAAAEEDVARQGAEASEAGQPQNTPPSENGIREGLKNALSNPDCKNLVDALLNAVATKKNPLGTQYSQGGIMGMFEAVMLEDGLTRTPVPGSAGYGSATGNIAQGDAQIFVVSRPFGPADQLQADTKGVLGELMHLGGQKKTYTDRAFANIVHRDYPGLTTSIWPGNPADTYHKAAMKDPNNISWSYYWHQAVNRKCF